MENMKQISEPTLCKPANYEYKISSYSDKFETIRTLRNDRVFCDIKLKTVDGSIILGHKVILASFSPYLHAMFTNFVEKKQDLVVIRHLHPTTLQLLVDFMYSGKIMINEKNIQVLLPAANLLQLEEVKEACCDIFQAQLCPTNVIGIIKFADLHNCTTLLKSSELYFQQHFSDVAQGEVFLSLSSKQMVKLISSNELTVPSEEKIFESVIRWVKHDLDSRKKLLPKLMAHVRLPLTSKDYILKHVVTEPLLKNCSKCKDYVIEALHCHLHKSDELITFPHNNRTKPRQDGGSHKVILVVGGLGQGRVKLDSTQWYDPKTNQWQTGPKMITPRYAGGLAVLKDNCVFYMGGNSGSTLQSVDVLDLSLESPNWKLTSNMLVKRQHFGVGVINNYIYAVGGLDGQSCLNSAEVFDYGTQEWRMISSMCTKRGGHGLGVLKNLLYAVGGYDSVSKSNSVECYHPGLDKWTPIAEMCFRRCNLGVGVVDDVLYAVGGNYGSHVYRSVEAYRPSSEIWNNIPDMHSRRQSPGVAVIDGLLYVIGGSDGASTLDSVEFYNPKTNIWTMVTASMNVARFSAGCVVIDMTF